LRDRQSLRASLNKQRMTPRIPIAMELVLLSCVFGECRNLLFDLVSL
jgi:hypothetical protein